MLRCYGDCAFSASFVRECADVSHVARKDVELTVDKESVVVEEIKEVELRSRRAQSIYDRNYNRNRWNSAKSNTSYRFFITEFETGYWRR